MDEGESSSLSFLFNIFKIEEFLKKYLHHETKILPSSPRNFSSPFLSSPFSSPLLPSLLFSSSSSSSLLSSLLSSPLLSSLLLSSSLLLLLISSESPGG